MDRRRRGHEALTSFAPNVRLHVEESRWSLHTSAPTQNMASIHFRILDVEAARELCRVAQLLADDFARTRFT